MKRPLAALAVLMAFSAGAVHAQTKTIRYHDYGKIVLHLPNWVMNEKGLCEKQGIKCEPVTLANAPLAQAAAAAGSVDIVNSTIDTTLQAIAKGNDLQIVGAWWKSNPYALSVRSDLATPNAAAGYPKNITDLKGLKIGVASRGSSTEIFMKSLLKSAGMPEDSVAYIPVGGPVTAYSAVAAKQVDAVLSWDPMPAFCTSTSACKLLVDMRNGEGPESFKALNSTSVFLQARREFVEKNAATIDAYNRAYGEALAWMTDPGNYAEVMAIAKRNMVLGEFPDREKLYGLIVKDALTRFSAKLERSSVKAWHDYLLQNKVIDKPLAVDTLIYKNAP